MNFKVGYKGRTVYINEPFPKGVKIVEIPDNFMLIPRLFSLFLSIVHDPDIAYSMSLDCVGDLYANRIEEENNSDT